MLHNCWLEMHTCGLAYLLRFWLHHTYVHVHVGGGLGDDVFSVGYDGSQFWMGGISIPVRDEPPIATSCLRPLQRHKDLSISPELSSHTHATPISRGDVIGCCVDLEKQVVSFTKNGKRVSGHLKLFRECSDLLTPTVSFSSGVR